MLNLKNEQLKKIIEERGVVDEQQLISEMAQTEDPKAHLRLRQQLLQLVAKNNYHRYLSDDRVIINSVKLSSQH